MLLLRYVDCFMRDRSRMYNDAAAIASDKFPVLGRMLLRFFEERDEGAGGGRTHLLLALVI